MNIFLALHNTNFRMVREFHSVNNTSQIRRLLKVLGQDFAVSQNPHAKKGGLIGLASIAVALGKVEKNLYYPKIYSYNELFVGF